MPSIGIHLDHQTISAVRLDGSVKNPTIAQFVAEPMPPQPPELDNDPLAWQAAALDEFLKRHKISRENAWLSIDSSHAIIRQFSVPFTAEDQIKKTIVFQAEAHIHSVPIDDLEMTWRKVAERKNTSEVLINAVRKEPLRQIIKSLKSEGIEPFGIDTPIGATANTALHMAPVEDGKISLWIDIGVGHTTMLVTQGNGVAAELKHVRVPRIGVNLPRDEHLVERSGALLRGQSGKLPAGPAQGSILGRDMQYVPGDSSAFNLPDILGDDGKPVATETLTEEVPSLRTTLATTGKTDFGLTRSSGHTMVLTAKTVIDHPEVLVRRIVTEISRTIIALSSDLQPSVIQLSGGGEASGMLVEALRAAFPDLEIQSSVVGLGLRTRPDTEAALASRSQALAVPLGMALKGLGVNHLGFEFRRGEFSMEDSFEVLKVPVTACVFLLMLLFGALCLFVMRNQGRIDVLRMDIQASAQKAFAKAYTAKGLDDRSQVYTEKGYTVPALDPELATTVDIYDRIYSDWQKAVKSVSADRNMPTPRSALVIWAAVQEAITRVGREPRQERLGPNVMVNGHKVSEYNGGGLFPRRRVNETEPHPDDRGKLELEWTITQLDITDKTLRIKGRAIKVQGLDELMVELRKFPELFGEVGMSGGLTVAPENVDGDPDSRRPKDERSVFNITAKIKPPPLPPRRAGSSSSQ